MPTVVDARSTSADSRSDQPLRVARPVASVTGLRRSGWRRSVDHDRESLRELGQNEVDQRIDYRNHYLGGPRRSLTGRPLNNRRVARDCGFELGESFHAGCGAC